MLHINTYYKGQVVTGCLMLSVSESDPGHTDTGFTFIKKISHANITSDNKK